MSEKQRNVTFKKRKEGLFKKLHELTTLCGVEACAVIYDPSSSSKAEIWHPQDRPDTVRRLLNVYKARKEELGQVRSYGVSDFFHEKKRKAEEELDRLRKKNRESKYPSSFEVLDSYDEDKLRQLGAVLKDKIDCAASRIELFKETEKELADLIFPSNNFSCNDNLPQQQQGLSYYHENHQDPTMMTMMMLAMKNNSEIPPHLHQISNINYGEQGGAQQPGLSYYHENHQDPLMTTTTMAMKNNNEMPPHLHQISNINYGEQGGALVNGTALQQFEFVLSNHENQQGCSVQFGPQISYMGQNHMICNNIESPAREVSLMGWDLESGNGGLEDIVAWMRRRI